MTKTIVVLKSDVGCEEYDEAIRLAGYVAHFEPILTIEYKTQNFSAPTILAKVPLVFTSIHGVESLIRHYDERDHDVYTVGDSTAQAARMAGFNKIFSAQGNGEDLAELMRHNIQVPNFVSPIYVRAEDVSYDLKSALTQNGINLHEIVGYKAILVEKLSIKLLHALDNREIKAFMAFSVRGAQAFADLIQQYGREGRMKGVKALCIGLPVVKSLSVLPFEQILIADTPTRDGMTDLLKTISID